MKPKIRFKKFEGEWRKAKLSSIAKRVTRKNTNLETTLPVTISAADGIVEQTSFFNNVVASSNLCGYYLIEQGEFAYNKSYSNGYPYGAVKRMKRYDKGALSTLYILFKVDETISSDYLLYFFETTLWHREIITRASEGARNHGLLNISAEDFLDIDIMIPWNISKQQKIADYFKTLDRQITLQSHCLDKLKQIKTASLQLMFPLEGETTPRIRFKGFEGEWTSHPLKEFARKTIEKNTARLYNETFTNSAEFGVISQRDFFDHDISNDDNISGYYVIHSDDFVYNPRISVTAPVGPINRNLLNRVGIMSPLYFIFRVDGVDKDYLGYFFKTTLWHKYMLIHGNTGARFDRLSITDDKFLDMPIVLPKDIAEQQKIADYFKTLDRQITLQTRRLEKLKQIKAACLDKMFV